MEDKPTGKNVTQYIALRRQPPHTSTMFSQITL